MSIKIFLTPFRSHWWQDSIFTASLLIAGFLHLIVLTLQFAEPTATDTSTKDIAVSIRPAEKEVKNADFFSTRKSTRGGDIS